MPPTACTRTVLGTATSTEANAELSGPSLDARRRQLLLQTHGSVLGATHVALPGGGDKDGHAVGSGSVAVMAAAAASADGSEAIAAEARQRKLLDDDDGNGDDGEPAWRSWLECSWGLALQRKRQHN